MTDKSSSLPPQEARTPNRAEINKWLDTRDDPFKILAQMRKIGNLAMVLEEWQKHLGTGAESAPQEAAPLADQLIDVLQENIGGNCDCEYCLENCKPCDECDECMEFLRGKFKEVLTGAERGLPVEETKK